MESATTGTFRTTIWDSSVQNDSVVNSSSFYTLINNSSVMDILLSSTSNSSADLNGTHVNASDSTHSSGRGPDPDLFDNRVVSIAFTVIYCVIWLFCVAGNILVLVVMKKSPSMHSRTNLFLSHLAVADLSVGLICIIPNIVHAHMVYWFPGPMGHFFCKLYNFVEEFSLTVSVLLLVLIAADRYVAILHPLKARRLFTKRRMYAALVLIWLAATIYSSPMLVIHITVVTNTGTTYCFKSWDIINLPLYTTFTAIVTYIIPLICMTAIYVRISLTLWRSSGGGPQNILQRDATSNSLTSSSRLNTRRGSSPAKTVNSTKRRASDSGANAINNSDNRDATKNIKVTDNHHLALVPETELLTHDESKKRDRDGGVDNDKEDSGVECPRRAHKSGSQGSNCSCSGTDAENCSRCSQTSRTSRASSDAALSSSTGSSNATHSDDGDRWCNNGRPFYHHHGHHRHQALELKVSNSSSNSGGASCDPPCSRSLVISRSSSANSSAPLIPCSSPVTPATSPTALTSQGGTSSLVPVEGGGGGGDGVYLLRRGNSAAGSCRLRVTSHRALVTRRKVVRMLIMVLAVFALTVFPYHMRAVSRYYMLPGAKFWKTGFAKYMMQILLFLNSALNPILYSLMSDSFRRSACEVLCPKRRRRLAAMNVAQAQGEAAFRTAQRVDISPERNANRGRMQNN